MWRRVSFCIAVVLAACANPRIWPEDRARACRIQVDEKFDRAAFRPNSLSSGAGMLSGAGQGFVAGLGFGYGAIIAAPIGLIVGAGYGTSCAVANARRPTADADFERLLQEADAHAMKRAIEAGLQAPRPECARASGEGHDAVVEIRHIEGGMACLHGRQEFTLAVKWRTVTARGEVLNESTLQHVSKSSRSVDEWFADPAGARREIEAAYDQVGRSIAREFTGSG